MFTADQIECLACLDDRIRFALAELTEAIPLAAALWDRATVDADADGALRALPAVRGLADTLSDEAVRLYLSHFGDEEA